MDIVENRAVGKKTLSLLIPPKGEQEDFRFRMLETNSIKYLLPVQKVYEAGQVRYLYDTTEQKSLADIAAQKHLDEHTIRQLTSQLLEGLLQGMEYYLDEDSYLLSPEYIYLNASETTYSFCYCPDYTEAIRVQVSGLTEFLMNAVNYEDLAAVKLVYGFYQLIKEEGFSARRLLSYVEEYHFKNDYNTDKKSIITTTPELIHSMHEECMTPGMLTGEPPVQRQFVPNPPVVENNIERPVEPILPVNPPIPPIEPPRPEAYQPTQMATEPVSQKAPKKGTIVVVLSVIAFLILFCAGYAAGFFYTPIVHQLDIMKLAVFAVLVCVIEGYIAWRMFGQNKETSTKDFQLVPCPGTAGGAVTLNQYPFVVGKDQERVQLVLSDAKVSRIHATINIQNDELYVMDASSLNGTFVNQTKLAPNCNQRLKVGDYISFANQVYQLSA